MMGRLRNGKEIEDMELGPVGAIIKRKLEQSLTPQFLEVIDESDQHAGHSGARSGGESHFRVRIVSPAFQGATRVARHRMVNGVLAEELRSHVHALAVEAKAPGE
jgi:BolA family transcriptional regulator, general stress-responsive regulator